MGKASMEELSQNLLNTYCVPGLMLGIMQFHVLEGNGDFVRKSHSEGGSRTQLGRTW
jgi:hypothetical protein